MTGAVLIRVLCCAGSVALCTAVVAALLQCNPVINDSSSSFEHFTTGVVVVTAVCASTELLSVTTVDCISCYGGSVAVGSC